MAEPRPTNIVEGATTGDLEEEIPVAAKSAEERKAAAAMSSLDSRAEDAGSSRDVDQAAIKKAMERLGGPALTNGTSGKQGEDKKVVKKAIKVDVADVNLLVCHGSGNLGRIICWAGSANTAYVHLCHWVLFFCSRSKLPSSGSS